MFLRFRRKCTHQNQIVKDITPVSEGCADCLAAGDTWVHLRMCMACGYVGCCNDSKNKHAFKHYSDVDHPIIKSIEPGESWMFCFADQKAVSM